MPSLTLGFGATALYCGGMMRGATVCLGPAHCCALPPLALGLGATALYCGGMMRGATMCLGLGATA
ncbi:hypothetical protein [Paenibacillus thalictri]|uniref:hypothetical protein n=1 Tax=Paenibacillus thalictri TaxID=2527873 RepID=UPI0013EF0AC5|nr:hypothetical protein [Paenibacillus thalictri]